MLDTQDQIDALAARAASLEAANAALAGRVTTLAAANAAGSAGIAFVLHRLAALEASLPSPFDAGRVDEAMARASDAPAQAALAAGADEASAAEIGRAVHNGFQFAHQRVGPRPR